MSLDLVFLMTRRPPTSTLFPYRRSSDLGSFALGAAAAAVAAFAGGGPVIQWALFVGVSAISLAALVPLGRRHRSEEHTSELQSHSDLVCRLLLEKNKLAHSEQRLARQTH